MKNLILLFILLFAFSINANSQNQKKLSIPEQMASEDLKELTSSLDMENDKMMQAFYDVFLKKQNDLSNPNLSEGDKDKIYDRVDEKIRSMLSRGQMDNLMAVDGLYDKLIK